MTIGATACVSVLYAVENAGLSLGPVSQVLRQLPLYDQGFGWVSVALVALVASLLLGRPTRKACGCA